MFRLPTIHFFFFFQAEDGIRDYKVTGVQTCALPIFYTYIAPLLGQTMHISDISELLIASGLGFVVGSWISGSVADRFGTTRSLVVSLQIGRASCRGGVEVSGGRGGVKGKGCGSSRCC